MKSAETNIPVVTQEQLAQLIALLQPQRPSSNITISAFVKKYLNFVQGEFSKKTFEIYSGVMDRFEKFVGSECMVDQLTALNLEDYKKYRAGSEGVCQTSVNIDVRTIKAAFNKMVDWELLLKNPFSKVKQYRINNLKIRSFTREQVAKLLNAIEEPWFKHLIMFAVYTGLRRGELVNMHWEQYNRERSELTIQSTSEYRVKGGKMRIISLHPEAVKILESLPVVNSYVFTREMGLKISDDLATKKLKKYIRRLQLPDDLHFHSLRHTFGTLAGESGVPIHVIKNAMGHSSVTTTEGYLSSNIPVMREQLKKIQL